MRTRTIHPVLTAMPMVAALAVALVAAAGGPAGAAAGSKRGAAVGETVGAAGEAAVCAEAPRPANPRATGETVEVHRYLWALTCGADGVTDGVVAGQNVGHGSQAADPEGWFGYPRLVAGLAEESGHHVGIVGVDYEHDQVFTPAQLAVANQVLIEHERRGGLAAVTWSPSSPWLNDERDIEAAPGTWTDTRTDAGQLDGVENLRDLLDPATGAGEVWQRKLTRIADALTTLRDAGVVVLWRPMQEMNGFWFWWGTTVHGDDASVYGDIWRHMYRYFTDERGLDNLLWVYSPASSQMTYAGQPVPNVRPAAWAYPGTEVVDIVAGTSYHDELLIPDYPDYLALPEVVGQGEFSAALLGEHDRDGDLDTRLYATRLREDYPATAFWVSWHDYPWSEAESAWLSLAGNQNAAELLDDPYVITAEELPCVRRPARAPA
jgi:mannan endo-1,4-beta-mannosidase